MAMPTTLIVALRINQGKIAPKVFQRLFHRQIYRIFLRRGQKARTLKARRVKVDHRPQRVQ